MSGLPAIDACIVSAELRYRGVESPTARSIVNASCIARDGNRQVVQASALFLRARLLEAAEDLFYGVEDIGGMVRR